MDKETIGTEDADEEYLNQLEQQNKTQGNKIAPGYKTLGPDGEHSFNSISQEKKSLRGRKEINNCLIDNLVNYILINRRVSKYKLDCFNKLKSKIKFRILWKLEYQIEGVVKSLDDNFVHVTTDNGEEIITHLDEIDCRTIFPLTYNPLKYPIRKSIPDELRKYILERDNNECQLKFKSCTKAATEIDHIIPVSKGGETIAENLQAACLTCNREKGAKVL